jgi:hypothetical protein
METNMPQELRDKLKMLGRYLISMGVMYAVGAGWITPANAGTWTTFLIESGGMAVAALPPLYAWLRVRNDNRFVLRRTHHK